MNENKKNKINGKGFYGGINIGRSYSASGSFVMVLPLYIEKYICLEGSIFGDYKLAPELLSLFKEAISNLFLKEEIELHVSKIHTRSISLAKGVTYIKEAKSLNVSYTCSREYFTPGRLYYQLNVLRRKFSEIIKEHKPHNYTPEKRKIISEFKNIKPLYIDDIP